MKKNNPILVFSGVLLVLLLTQSACNHSPNELAFEQNDQIYVIDKESSKVTIFTDEGALIDSIGVPSAGAVLIEDSSLPPEIIRFLLMSKGSIDGYVWNDSDADGNIDNSEAPIPGVNVYVDLNNDDEFTLGEPTGTTDSNGYYQIQQLRTGTFKVHVDNSSKSLPVAYHRKPASGANPATVTLARNQTSTVSFGYQIKATVSGVVRDATGKTWSGVFLFIDLNGNGVHDFGEPMVITDKNGYFIFYNLLPGEYTILIQSGPLLTNNIVVLSPGTITIGEDERHTVNFITQTKLGVVHSLKSPTRLSWGDDGNLYVSDNINGSVFIYDNALNVQGELKKLSNPLGIIADADGNIYVGNQSSNNVEVYDSTGELLNSIGNGNIEMPNDLTFDANKNIYILDSANDTVLVYDLSGNFKSSIGSSPRINFAISIAISYYNDVKGELYVADQSNCTIHVFGLDGTVKTPIGKCGTRFGEPDWSGKFSGLMAIDVDKYGNIHGLDNSLNVVQVFEPKNGTFLRSYNAYTIENENKLNLQSDITINPVDSRVVVSNVATKNVQTISTITAP